MFVTVSLQGEASFPNTDTTVQSDVSAQIQAIPLTVQAFTITLPDWITRISEFQAFHWTYAATLQIVADDQWDEDGVTAAVLDAFETVTGFRPSAVKAQSRAIDPGGVPGVSSSGWDLFKRLHTDARVLTIGLLVVAGLAVVFIGRNVRVSVPA